MTFAAGSFHGLRYVAESAWGVTPSTPSMIDLRHTSCNLGLSKETFTSGELRADRMISDMRHGNKKVAGDVGVDFSWKEYDALLESTLMGAWNANVLKAGVTPKSFTVERKFGDITQYGKFTGCMVDKFSLSIKPNAIVTGTFSFVGSDGTFSGTPLDATPDASQTESPYDSFTGTISEGGSPIAILTGLDFSLENGINPAMVVGSSYAAALVPVRFERPGTRAAA